jgi:regulator of RNase E activity RraA
MSEVDTSPRRRNAALPAGWEKLFAAVLSDALDAAGCMGQAMSPRLRPLDDTLKLCGRARTGQYVEVDHVAPDVNPYELEIAIVDDLQPGDVAVFACGGSHKIAPWGSLLSTATRARGAAGCVTDGFVRDIQDIRAMQLPVFSGGIAPLDSKGRGHIAAIDVTVVCDGVTVSPGDLVFGDADGVVVIPQAIEAEVLRLAFDKINGEHHSMGELRQGSYLRDVYAKYGVL